MYYWPIGGVISGFGLGLVGLAFCNNKVVSPSLTDKFKANSHREPLPLEVWVGCV